MGTAPTVYILDDEESIRRSLSLLMRADGLHVECFSSGREFLKMVDTLGPGCLILDIYMPDMDGLEVQRELRTRGVGLPVIALTGHADVATAIQAMRGGAADFIEKPFDSDDLSARVQECLRESLMREKYAERKRSATALIEQLTLREREIADMLVAGKRNKEIAKELDISTRTVELHRAHVFHKLNAKSLSEVVRIMLIVEQDDPLERWGQ